MLFCLLACSTAAAFGRKNNNEKTHSRNEADSQALARESAARRAPSLSPSFPRPPPGTAASPSRSSETRARAAASAAFRGGASSACSFSRAETHFVASSSASLSFFAFIKGHDL